MNTEFFNALDELERKRGIPKEYMLDRIEKAILNAAKKEAGTTNVKVVIDPVKADVKAYRLLEVVEDVTDDKSQISLEDANALSKRNRKYSIGNILEVEMKTKNFGRISAQTAKQGVIQAIREFERGIMVQEYESKREDIISAVIEKVDETSGNAVVNTGTGFATLLKKEQLPGDNFKPGDHVKVFITEVRPASETKGPIVTLSRTHQNFVKRLFELEVPEIAEGTVSVMGITREAGNRTKISVMSRSEGVDPVGSCIGSRGIRISAIMKELNGEKIDIIKYSENPEEYVKAALSPATVKDVILENERSYRVIVDADQLSLAIGREGQNARLAAKLTGFKIDIKTE